MKRQNLFLRAHVCLAVDRSAAEMIRPTDLFSSYHALPDLCPFNYYYIFLLPFSFSRESFAGIRVEEKEVIFAVSNMSNFMSNE